MSLTLGNAAHFSLLANGSINLGTGNTIVIRGDGGEVLAGSNLGNLIFISGVMEPDNGTSVDNGLTDAQTAYSTATGMLAGTTFPASHDFGGTTLVPGTYAVSGQGFIGTGKTFTLNGAGQYVFQIQGQFTIQNASVVLLTNGATACSIYWTTTNDVSIGQSVTDNLTFAGNLLAGGSINVEGTGTIDGRLITVFGVFNNINLDRNTIGATCVCFVKGTMIKTIDGYRSIENLKVGDPVIIAGTISLDYQFFPTIQNNIKKIKWLGKYTHINMRKGDYPVCIKKDAISPNVPDRDLYVSLLHSVMIDGKMTCAGNLINGTTIYEDSNFSSVEYYHLELDEHCAIISNGLPSETLLKQKYKYQFTPY